MREKDDLELLKHFTKSYEKIADKYHKARFGNRRGKYDLFESMKSTFELCDELGLDLNALNVLDVACGTGKISQPLAKRGACVTGLDGSVGMLRQYRKNALADQAGDRLQLVNASAEVIPYAPNSFDMVISSRFLHLFPLSYYPVIIGEMLRVVKSGGYVIVEMKNKYYGVVVNHLKKYFRYQRIDPPGSTVSLPEVYGLQKQLVDARVVTVKSCQLPKAHLLPLESGLSVVLSSLSRTWLKPVSGFFFVVLKKGDGPAGTEYKANK